LQTWTKRWFQLNDRQLWYFSERGGKRKGAVRCSVRACVCLGAVQIMCGGVSVAGAAVGVRQIELVAPGFSVATREQVDKPNAGVITSVDKEVFVYAETASDLQVGAPLTGLFVATAVAPCLLHHRHSLVHDC
jgi:hypothetical protein